MAKEAHDIRGFSSGLMLSPSGSDIPEDAASYSLNIDPLVGEGKLAGIPDSVELRIGAVNNGEEEPLNVCARAVTELGWNESGEYRNKLAWVDPSLQKLVVVDDIYEQVKPAAEGPQPLITYNTYGTNLVQTDTKVTMSPHGQNLHIGLGADKSPKWFGKPIHNRFGVEPTSPVLEDARIELCYPKKGGGAHKPVPLTDGIVFFEFGTAELFAIDTNATILARSSSPDELPNKFVKLQAICKCKDSTITGYDNCFWLYDNDATDWGTLYLVKFDNSRTTGKFSIERAVAIHEPVNGIEDPNTFILTDMVQTVRTVDTPIEYYLWFSFHYNGGDVVISGGRSTDPTDVHPTEVTETGYSQGYGTLLFRSESAGSPADAAVITLINKTPNMNLRGKGPSLWMEPSSPVPTGAFCVLGTGLAIAPADMNFRMRTSPTPLVDCEDIYGRVYYLFHCYKGEGTDDPSTFWAEQWSLELDLVIYHPHIDLFSFGAWRISPEFVPSDSLQWPIPLLPNEEEKLRYFKLGYSESYNEAVGSYAHDVMGVLCHYNDNTALAVMVRGETNTVTVYNSVPVEYDYTALGWDVPGAEYFTSLQNIDLENKSWSMADVGSSLFYATESGGTYWAKSDYSESSGIIYLGTQLVIRVPDFIFVGKTAWTDSPAMSSSRFYYYTLAWEYDKSQIGPLSESLLAYQPEEDEKAISLSVFIAPNDFPATSRLSGFYIFRSYTEGFVNELKSTPKMLKYFDLTESQPRAVAPDENTADYYAFEVADTDILGAIYDTVSGCSSTQKNCTPNYSISCTGQGYNFISGCGGVDGYKDLSNYVFRSQPNRFDVFNLLEDFVMLPEKPLAMAYYNGKLFCFVENRCFVVNVLGDLYVENQLEGIGCVDNASLIVTDLGLFVAGSSNIYLNTGAGFQEVGNVILKSAGNHAVTGSASGCIGYLERMKTVPPVVAYDEKRAAFLIFYKTANPHAQNYCLVYSPGRKRWDLWDGPEAGYYSTGYVVGGALSGKGGVIIPLARDISVENNFWFSQYNNWVPITGIHRFLGSSNKRSYSWYSKLLDMGTSGMKKKFYDFIVNHIGTLTASAVSLVNACGQSIATWRREDSTGGTHHHIGTATNMDSSHLSTGVHIKLSSIPGDTYVDSITTVFRRKIGVRHRGSN